MIVGFYGRVSTEEQRERHAITSQVEYAQKRAALEGWTLRIFLDDGVSGTLPLERRPAGAELLAAARAHEIDVVATYKLDRLGRTQLVILEAIEKLKRAGVAYRSLTEPFATGTAFGDAALGMVAVFAQFDRATFLERSARGTATAARQPGRWLGGIVPYGYRKREDLTLEVDERPIPGLALSEAEVVRMVFRWCADDGWGVERIARELDARGIPTSYTLDRREMLAGETHGTRAREGKRKRATAGRWPHSRVLAILHGEIYRGVHRYGRRSSVPGRELIERAMPAIVSPALWERAQRRLTDNRRWQRAHPRRRYLLRGILTCECGHVLIGSSYAGRAGREVLTYRCGRHPTRPAPRVVEAAAEPRLWADVVRFFGCPDEVLRGIAHRSADAGAREARADEELLQIAAAQRDIEAQERRLLDAALRELFRPEIVAAKRAALREERSALERRADRIRRERQAAAAAAGETAAVRRLLATLAERARNATPEVRASVLRALVKRTRVSWWGKQTRLEVVYGFSRTLGPLTEPTSVPSVAATDVDEWSLEHVIERVHMLPETGRWVRVGAGA